MDLKLAGKTAIVTGGSRGLGEAICKDLAKEGADVVINYAASTDKAEKLAETIVREYDVKAMAVKADISKEDEVKALFEKAAGLTGKIDILVNNAGVCPVIMIKDTPLDVWEQVLKVNMTGVFLTCRGMVNYSIENKIASNIINISSQSAFNGSKRGKTHYSASKGGVVSFTISLAKEVSSYGIRVNSVAPGMMYTDMTAEVLDKETEKYNQQIPIGRVATVEEVARVVSFVAGDPSSYMTGAVVDISGGLCSR